MDLGLVFVKTPDGDDKAGDDKEKEIPIHYMFMMVQILHPHLAIIFYFALYLADLIHEGLIGIQEKKVTRPFTWYSLLMHMILFKGADYFEKEMELKYKNHQNKN